MKSFSDQLSSSTMSIDRNPDCIPDGKENQPSSDLFRTPRNTSQALSRAFRLSQKQGKEAPVRRKGAMSEGQFIFHLSTANFDASSRHQTFRRRISFHHGTSSRLAFHTSLLPLTASQAGILLRTDEPSLRIISLSRTRAATDSTRFARDR